MPRRGAAIDDAQLVQQDLLGRARLRQRRGVDHPQQRGDQELVREDRELLHEVAELGVAGPAFLEPAGIGIVEDDRVMEQVVIDFLEKIMKLLDLLRRKLATPQPLLDPWRKDQCFTSGHGRHGRLLQDGRVEP